MLLTLLRSRMANSASLSRRVVVMLVFPMLVCPR